MNFRFRNFRKERELAGLPIEVLSKESGLTVELLARFEDKSLWDGTESLFVAHIDATYDRLAARDRERFKEIAAKMVDIGLSVSVCPPQGNSRGYKYYSVEIGDIERAECGTGITYAGSGWTPYAALVDAKTRLDEFNYRITSAFMASAEDSVEA